MDTGGLFLLLWTLGMVYIIEAYHKSDRSGEALLLYFTLGFVWAFFWIFLSLAILCSP